MKKLIHVLDDLVAKGNTVVVIEHNLDVIKSADYIIDMGPEGGNAGGQVVATGTPEEVAGVEESHTGQFLRERLMLEAAADPSPRAAGHPQRSEEGGLCGEDVKTMDRVINFNFLE